MLDAIAGYDPGRRRLRDQPVEDFTRDLGGGVAGLRIGIARKLFWSRCDPEIEAACEAAIDVLRGLGATVHDVDLRCCTGPAARRSSPWKWRPTTPLGCASTPTAMATTRAPCWRQAHLSPAPPTCRLSVCAPNSSTKHRALFNEIDILASPTSPIVAPTIEAGDPKFVLARYIMDFNITAIPAISIPCGFSGNGLPISLMLGGRHFGESALLRAAHAYEQATDWHTRRPSL